MAVPERPLTLITLPDEAVEHVFTLLSQRERFVYFA